MVKENLLPELDFSDFDTCIECVKGKMTKSRNKDSNRSTEPLQLIHTDICGPFAHQTICGNKYFITFIDDYTRYCTLFLISEKFQSLEKFKIFKAEAEKELGKQIKAMRSDRGGEYYGRYTETGQHKGLFALYLQEHGIQAQYTTPGSPESNGVSERKNRTLLNMGCKAEARPYNPKEEKLDPKTISANFIGYPENSRGYRFYCPTHSTRIIETNKAVFLDEINYTHTYEDLELDFQELTEDEPQSNVVPINFEAAAGNVGQPQLEVVANQNDDSENSEDDLEEVEQEPESQNLQDVQALAKDSNSLGDAKKYLLEMIDKGMQPNARTYTPVFKAFARLEEDNVKKGKEFRMEMKAVRFRANKKAVMEVLKDRKGPVVKTDINILFGKQINCSSHCSILE
ncbi:hypothetical protein ACLB2K_065115 [Fragaria x ananassa]